MTVYIEYVLIDNFIIDFILLFSLFKILKKRVKTYRQLLAALFGAVTALLLPILSVPTALLYILKFASGAFMVYIACEFSTIKEYIRSAALFFLLTFALGGIIIGLFFMLKIDYSLSGNFNYISNIPIGLVVLAAFLTGFAVKIIFDRLYRKKNVNAFVYDCSLALGGVSVRVRGFLDSGNQLYAEGNSPVIITGKSTASKLFKEGLFSGRTKAQYLEFSTIGGKNRMLVFKIDKLEIYIGKDKNIIDNIMLGISPYHIKGNEDYDLILHPSLI